MRLALSVEYDGRGFNGWQRQKDVPSVQAALESALTAIAGHEVTVVCAGRTDTGVHALHQVVHFDTTANRPTHAWVYGTNTHLPRGVAVTGAVVVAEHFHARFSAVSRRYHYHLLNHPVRPALWGGRVSWECRPLAFERMAAAAADLLGTHDFTAFRGQGCQARTPVREVTLARLSRRGALITLEIEADGFLMHMVRNVVGVLVDIGLGKREPGWVDELLAPRPRSEAGATASAAGLYLARIAYPPRFRVPDAGSGAELDALLLA